MILKRMTSLFLLSVLIIAFMQVVAFADWDAILSQAYINENELDLFLSAEFGDDSLCVKVANQEATICDSGMLSDESVDIRTTVLVDISASMPKTARGKAVELINCMIKNLAKNEQLRIVTFGEDSNILIDFSSDRYDLDKVVENIKFNGRKSAIYDAVYNTLPEIDLTNEKPCFYRTIVITDGADCTTQGVTKEELFMKLHSETYPLDVVCVSKSEPSGQNKDLSALSRISNGRYFDVYSETDVTQLCSELSVSNFSWVRAEVPISLLDGSTRQVDILNGGDSFSFDMKMSVVDAPVESQTVTSAPIESFIEPTLSAEDKENQPLNMLIIVIVSVLAVVAVSGFAVVIINKKKRAVQQPQTIQHSYPAVNSNIIIGETEIVEEAGNKEHYSIKISNVSNQNDSWTLEVFSDIIIGRAESCAIIIDEKSVSREQCKIVANKNGLTISNLSSSNKTKLNGTVLATEVVLHPADNIHFGRVTLRVDYIQKVTDEASLSQQISSVSDVAKTQSIF